MWLVIALRPSDYQTANYSPGLSYPKKFRDFKIPMHPKKKIGIVFTIKNNIFRTIKWIYFLENTYIKLLISQRDFVGRSIWVYRVAQIKEPKL